MKCTLCSKQFRDTGALNEHFKRVHQGVYYECSVCSKKYVRKMELNEHFFVHRGFKVIVNVNFNQYSSEIYLNFSRLTAQNAHKVS
jgi:C2H2-type zinc finger/Zinc finger, C2H2 type